jgi:hypothetical protein
MFFLPAPDRRTELMIIYGEAIDRDAAAEEVPWDDNRPDAARTIVERARQKLSIHNF